MPEGSPGTWPVKTFSPYLREAFFLKGHDPFQIWLGIRQGMCLWCDCPDDYTYLV